MDSLRQEILEAQKRRADLIKWKLLLVSTLAATGLGLTNSPSVPYSELVLCCIPFVCAYVDSLCCHQALVINVIGEFIRTRSDSKTDTQDIIEYEKFALKVRQISYRKRKISAYDLERLNLRWSSLIFSALTAIYAIIQHRNTSIPIFISGAIGILLTLLIQSIYETRRNKIREVNE
jgi:hypothetical protein